MSRDREPPNYPQLVRASNQTSELFLGTVPRQWMIGNGNLRVVTNPTEATSNLHTPSRTVVRREVAGGTPQLARHSIPTTVAVDTSTIEPDQTQPSIWQRHQPGHQQQQSCTEAEQRDNNHNNHVTPTPGNANSVAITSNGSSTAPGTDRLPPSLPAHTTSSVTTGNLISPIAPTGQLQPAAYHYHGQPMQSTVLESTDHYLYPRLQPPLQVGHLGVLRSPTNTSSSVTSPTSLSITGSSDAQTPQIPNYPAHMSTTQATEGPNTAAPALWEPDYTGTAVSRPDLLDLLNAEIKAIRPKITLNYADSLRIIYLQKACRYSDPFFMVLHQLCCIASKNPQLLTSSLGLNPVHMGALPIIEQVLGGNRKLSPGLFFMFCDFVSPMQTLAVDHSFQTWLPKVKHFLSQLNTRWHTLNIKVRQRYTPPSALELVEFLAADGYIFSQVLFVWFFQQIFPAADRQFSKEAFHIFSLSQKHFLRLTAQGFVGVVQDEHRILDGRTFRAKFGEVQLAYSRRMSLPLQARRGQPASDQTNTSMSVAPVNMIASTGPTAPTRILASSTNVNVGMAGFAGASPRPVPNVSPGSGPAPFQTRLFPAADERLIVIANPDPNRLALHQLHLSHTNLQEKDGATPDKESPKWYSFLECLIGATQTFDSETVYEAWNMSIPSAIYARKIQEVITPHTNAFKAPARTLENQSIIFHVRCIDVTKQEDPLTEADFSAAPTFWPEHLFLSLNDTHLEFRRKIFHGRNLPVDVTQLLLENSNEMKLSYHVSRNEAGKKFIVVLEAINILQYEDVIKLPASLDARASLEIIENSLKTNDVTSAIEDDDIIMTEAQTSIDLIDPFTARIFDQPVRGITCRHRECFDLESFIRSRNCRFKNGLVQPDEWQCPICKKDARPANLVIDRFLLQVKEELIASGQADTRAIIVKEDGSWEPQNTIPSTGRYTDSGRLSRKESEVHQESITDEELALKPPAQLTPSSLLPASNSAVIDLLDDD